MKIYVICNSLKAYHLKISEKPNKFLCYVPVSRNETMQSIGRGEFYMLAHDYDENPEWPEIKEQLVHRFMQEWNAG